MVLSQIQRYYSYIFLGCFASNKMPNAGNEKKRKQKKIQSGNLLLDIHINLRIFSEAKRPFSRFQELTFHTVKPMDDISSAGFRIHYPHTTIIKIHKSCNWTMIQWFWNHARFIFVRFGRNTFIFSLYVWFVRREKTFTTLMCSYQ